MSDQIFDEFFAVFSIFKAREATFLQFVILVYFTQPMRKSRYTNLIEMELFTVVTCFDCLKITRMLQ